MKSQMLEFMLHLSGVNPLGDYPHLHMRAPHGHIVYGPKASQRPTRMQRFHARHFPGHSYDFGPHGRGYTGTGAIGYGAIVGTYAAAGLYAVSAPFILATDTYSTVAASQYQSAMSGQPSGASDPRLLFGGAQGIDYFLRGWI